MYPVPLDCQQIFEGNLLDEEKAEFGKSNITVINQILLFGNIIIDSVLIISSINIFYIDYLVKVLLFIHSQTI